MRTFAAAAVFGLVAQAGVITNNFTVNDGGFTASSTGGSTWTYVSGSYWRTNTDGTNYSNGTRTELTSPSFTASGGAISVSFSHFGTTEATFDGGVLAYSVNGGGTNYVGNGSFTANGYNGSASGDSETRTFLGTGTGTNLMFSGAFDAQISSAGLGTFNAGDQVRVLFRFASDPSVTNTGWRLTDFTINGVDAPESGIPEPSTISLIGAGAVLLFLRRRK